MKRLLFIAAALLAVPVAVLLSAAAGLRTAFADWEEMYS